MSETTITLIIYSRAFGAETSLIRHLLDVPDHNYKDVVYMGPKPYAFRSCASTQSMDDLKQWIHERFHAAMRNRKKLTEKTLVLQDVAITSKELLMKTVEHHTSIKLNIVLCYTDPMILQLPLLLVKLNRLLIMPEALNKVRIIRHIYRQYGIVCSKSIREFKRHYDQACGVDLVLSIEYRTTEQLLQQPNIQAFPFLNPF